MQDILRLRVLAAVASQGSVTKAAKHLNYSLPAVSHHLARLEAETGARLVQRVGRGIRLTPEGEHLARRAAEIVGRADTAAAEHPPDSVYGAVSRAVAATTLDHCPTD